LDLEKANQIIDEVLSTFPNEARYLDTKGLILFQQGKYPDAKTYFERACGAAESNDKTCIEHLGDVLFMLGNKEGAVGYWLRAKELGSANKMLNEKITQKKYAKPVY
jgi:tetratricopeptide (TPR) repeat protein